MAFAKRKIMVVDDDQSFLEMLKDYFLSHQYEVSCANSASKAIVSMREKRHKVVILDYQMPEVKGDDLIAMLQKINPSARFIIVTGVLSEDVEQKFKGLGYFAYFEKAQLPFKKLENTVLSAFDN